MKKKVLAQGLYPRLYVWIGHWVNVSDDTGKARYALCSKMGRRSYHPQKGKVEIMDGEIEMCMKGFHAAVLSPWGEDRWNCGWDYNDYTSRLHLCLMGDVKRESGYDKVVSNRRMLFPTSLNSTDWDGRKQGIWTKYHIEMVVGEGNVVGGRRGWYYTGPEFWADKEPRRMSR